MRNLIIVFALLFTQPAWADAVTKPHEIAGIIKADAPIGQGALTRLWFKGYDASLWTDAPEWSFDVTYALSLTYGMSFSADELIERSIEEMMHAQELTKAEQDDYAKQLNTVFRDVKKGDVITALSQPDKGISFFYNGNKTGSITDPILAKRFMAIWLGKKTTEPELRQALLGQ